MNNFITFGLCFAGLILAVFVLIKVLSEGIKLNKIILEMDREREKAEAEYRARRNAILNKEYPEEITSRTHKSNSTPTELILDLRRYGAGGQIKNHTSKRFDTDAMQQMVDFTRNFQANPSSDPGPSFESFPSYESGPSSYDSGSSDSSSNYDSFGGGSSDGGGASSDF